MKQKNEITQTNWFIPTDTNTLQFKKRKKERKNCSIELYCIAYMGIPRCSRRPTNYSEE